MEWWDSITGAKLTWRDPKKRSSYFSLRLLCLAFDMLSLFALALAGVIIKLAIENASTTIYSLMLATMPTFMALFFKVWAMDLYNTAMWVRHFNTVNPP